MESTRVHRRAATWNTPTRRDGSASITAATGTRKGTMKPLVTKFLFRTHAFYLSVLSVYVVTMQWTTFTSFPDSSSFEFIAVERPSSLRHRMLQSFEHRQPPDNIPTCAKDLFVELQDSKGIFLCWGLLVRDDAILADHACVTAAAAAIVVQPSEPLLLHHDQAAATLVPQRRRLRNTKQVHPEATLVEIDMPPVHYQSGWPRQRLFLRDVEQDQAVGTGETQRALQDWDSSSAHVTLAKGASLHVECVGDLPVVSLLRKDVPEANQLGDKRNELLHYPQDMGAAAMGSTLGERWWIPKKGKSELLQELFARKPLYASADPNRTLDILRPASRRHLLLEADDPWVRNSGELPAYLQAWQKEVPFSGEPFFQWLDFGKGRVVSNMETSRADLDTMRCTVMDDDARAKAVVVPSMVEGKVVLRYEKYDLPVESGYMLYVWGTDGKLYVHTDDGIYFHHICFFGGKPVRMAGEVGVGEHGVIQEMWPQSGHYAPSDWHYRQLYRHLKNIVQEVTWGTMKWENDYTSMNDREWKIYMES